MVRTMPGVLLVVNPQASAVTDAGAEAVAGVLGRDVEIARTERRGHALELVRDADAGAVVVFGGDGAFNEALNGLRAELPIGLVPGGGSSVLPRALGLPDDPEGAARQIGEALRAGRSQEISLGRVNGRRFGFAAALGFPAEVVRRVDGLGRGDRGRRPPDRVFLTTAARMLAERRGRLPSELEVLGHGRTSFALVANGDPYTYLGRLPVRAAPRASWEDGLDVVGPRAVGPLSIPRLVLAALTGRTPNARGVLYLHDVDAIELRADRPLPLQVDGEDLGDVERADLASEPNAAKILV
jgi:diacylglycerol kinase family enzyme